MEIINTDVLHRGTSSICQPESDHSIVKKISSEDYFVSPQRLNKTDPDFHLRDDSRGSSMTSTTDPLEDSAIETFENVIGGEDDNDSRINENVAITAITEEKSEAVSDSNGVTSASTVMEPSSSRRLKFTTLTIREYWRVLGDNVTVMGPPISLSWEHQGETVYDLAEYEEAVKDTRRSQSELKMPSKHRDQMLKDGGFSRASIMEAIKKSNIARNQRKRTVETLNLQPLQEAIEKIVRATKKPLRKKARNGKAKAKSRNTI